MEIKLKAHERLDDLVLDGMKIIQRDDQFCFSLDTVLLANFGEVPHGPVLDLGTGTAAIPLILSARGATGITGVELNPVMADLAGRNVRLNHREDTIRIIESDYRTLRDTVKSGSFATIYANPPYREKGRGAESRETGIRRARHEETASLAEVMKAVQYMLKYHGRFRMVHITERLAEVCEMMRSYDIEPKRLQLIYGRPDKPAKLFLVEGIRGGNTGLVVMPPLIVHQADGSYSPEVMGMYEGKR